MVVLIKSRSNPIKTSKIYIQKGGWGEWTKFGFMYVFLVFEVGGITEMIWEVS